MRWLARINPLIGSITAWGVLLLVLLMFSIVMLRYLFQVGWIAMQETAVYLHAGLFMLGIAYTLANDGHVRVDIFYRNASKRWQAWCNLLGSLLLLVPVAITLFVVCWDYVKQSWLIWESSREAGGLAFVYGLKTLLIIMPVLLLLQGVVIIAASFQQICRGSD